MEESSDHPAPADGSELKARIFAAFDQACRQGEVEVADELLAIINAKWMRQPRAPKQRVTGVFGPGNTRAADGTASTASR